MSNEKYLSQLIIGAFLCLTVASYKPVQGSCCLPDLPDEAYLHNKGFETSTLELLIEASHAASCHVRYRALRLLTKRIGVRAIPTLKKALSDPQLSVRKEVALTLSTVGDLSGIEQMQKDFKVLVPDHNTKFASNSHSDTTKNKEDLEKWEFQLFEGLRVAKVLAELGDLTGYELAAEMAITGKRSYFQKQTAIDVLATMAEIDKSQLQRHQADPIDVLKASAASMTQDDDMHYVLIHQVSTHLKTEDAIEVIKILQKNPNIPKSVTSRCEIIIRELRQGTYN